MGAVRGLWGRGLWRKVSNAGRMVGALALLSGVLAFAGPLSMPTSAGAAAGLPSFYNVPKKVPTTVGTLIKYQKATVGGVDGTTYRVMYTSTDLSNRPVVVTGLVFVPKKPAPAGGYPVVTWGHGTNGMAEQCAPSLQPASAVPLLNNLLDQGWMVTASDYQGEGTTGPLSYLVGELAARNTIDIVRAVQHFPPAHASSSYVVWGHSEGGQTAMFGLHLGASYAPELHLAGVVAGAPPSQFGAIYDFLTTSPYRFYLFMAGVGFEHAYGPAKAPLDAILTPTALKLEPVVNGGCFNYLQTKIDHYRLAQIVKTNPFNVPQWKALLTENDPGSFTTPVQAPLLIIQGGSDEQIPVISTQLLATHLCGIGQDTERWIYPVRNHTGVLAPSSVDMVHWITDRFAGDPNPDPYQPVGQPGIQTSTCAG